MDRSRRLLWLVCLLLGGCAAGTGQMSSRMVTVATPPGIDAPILAPRRGDDLSRARTPLDQIVAALPRPAYLQPQDTRAPATARPDPPLAAQRAYIAGRDAWREGKGRNFEAIRQLQNALVLAPNEPAILRLLGRIYTSSGNAVRGAIYLQQAVAQQPDDLDSVFLLARHAYSQRLWDEAIVTLAHALSLDQTDADPALPALLRYFLGSALERQGYDEEAIAQFGHYLSISRDIDRGTALVRELGLLLRQRGQTWQTIGDAYHRLGDPARAMDAYSQAVELELSDSMGMVRRLTYTHLRLGQRAAAEQTVIEAIRRDDWRNDALPLVAYLQKSGSTTGKLAQQLEEVYRAHDRPTGLALALANLLSPDKAELLLQEHLSAKPGDRQVFETILSRLLETEGDAPSLSQLQSAARTTVAAIKADRRWARQYAVTLITRAPEPKALVEAIDQMPEDQRQDPVVRLLRGLGLLQSAQIEPAIADLTTATEAGLESARLALVTVMVARKQYQKAEELLQPLADRDDPEIIGLRVKVLAENDRSEEALQLLDRVLAARPNDVGLVIDKAVLLLRTGRALEAERLLLDALNVHPREERLYEALFGLYDPPNREASQVPDAMRQWQRLMQRLLGTIPNSRLARIKGAEWHLATREFDNAEQSLRSVLAENPLDSEALDMMLELFEQTNRRDEGTKLLEQALTAAPKDRRLLATAVAHYERRIKDPIRAGELREQLILLEPAGPLRSLMLGQVYFEAGRYADALAQAKSASASEDEQTVRVALQMIRRCLVRLRQPDLFAPMIADAIARFPQRQADLRFELAQLLQAADQWEQAEKIMLELLQQSPEDADLNNHLGYTWAEQGRNLEQALRMIEIAVEQQPDNAAYLDSMGWVLYKLGRFDEALTWLTRARARGGGEHPVILNHLGDAQYRVNRKTEAVRSWKAALAKLDPEEAIEDAEQRGMDQRLKAKIDAVGKNEPAQVAHAPGAPPPEIPPEAPQEAPPEVVPEVVPEVIHPPDAPPD